MSKDHKDIAQRITDLQRADAELRQEALQEQVRRAYATGTGTTTTTDAWTVNTDDNCNLTYRKPPMRVQHGFQLLEAIQDGEDEMVTRINLRRISSVFELFAEQTFALSTDPVDTEKSGVFELANTMKGLENLRMVDRGSAPWSLMSDCDFVWNIAMLVVGDSQVPPTVSVTSGPACRIAWTTTRFAIVEMTIMDGHVKTAVSPRLSAFDSGTLPPHSAIEKAQNVAKVVGVPPCTHT